MNSTGPKTLVLVLGTPISTNVSAKLLPIKNYQLSNYAWHIKAARRFLKFEQSLKFARDISRQFG